MVGNFPSSSLVNQLAGRSSRTLGNERPTFLQRAWRIQLLQALKQI
jgi:DNA repair exonuclease SbcCD ATPase subunit